MAAREARVVFGAGGSGFAQGGKPSMKPMGMLLAAAYAGLLSATVIAPSRPAHAQDVEQSKLESQSCLCLAARVNDTVEGMGNVFFTVCDGQPIFFSFYWNEQNYAFGPASGSISSGLLEFSGNAGDDCTVTGNGTAESGKFWGEFEFHGTCEDSFAGGIFSTSTIGCEPTATVGGEVEGWHADVFRARF